MRAGRSVSLARNGKNAGARPKNRPMPGYQRDDQRTDSRSSKSNASWYPTERRSAGDQEANRRFPWRLLHQRPGNPVRQSVMGRLRPSTVESDASVGQRGLRAHIRDGFSHRESGASLSPALCNSLHASEQPRSRPTCRRPRYRYRLRLSHKSSNMRNDPERWEARRRFGG